MQNKWQKNLEEYLLNRKQLKLLVQLIDSRHEIQKNDLIMREWIQHNKLKSIVIATKIDLTPKSKILTKINTLKKELETEVFPFSVKDSRYNENIIKYFESL